MCVLVLAFLLASLLLRRDRSGFLAALVGACAVQAAIVSLAHYYEIHAFRSQQPNTATAIPPLAWAALQFSAVRRPRLPHDLVHLIGSGSGLATSASVARPALLDALIPALFLGYGAVILAVTWRGSEGFARPVALWKEARA